ncbi:hypothetical protein CHGG_02224 [Chaetomium globosum CBS 148.51]|uniref:Indoleamine 2,3-dioxygenase n=1 Tax=Chaetomium globosum (strain ATCC 6205 / CBS 148.51 / DSM 1962 / NBRC 6347 / NRRL 1970) TaxID=306901 RepID=Q2HC30_CHAGB|nr:uncharacterized protein CHGG_02224 [Chaetomium globosum CBS 148.51]EAQ90289.1 hypothetical protein CHGG_02224 [Chaetomium globosum CBS 148.51]
MFDIVGFIILSALGSFFTALAASPKKQLKLWFLASSKTIHDEPQPFSVPGVEKSDDAKLLQEINNMADCHETAALLADLIRKDGAGCWPPRAEHDHTAWPAALRPYREIYEEVAPLLPTEHVSLDDEVNKARITSFRTRLQQLLHERVDLTQVEALLAAADAGRWDVFPRDTYNAFYACVAWCRHAYRWATIPVVRLAQLEKTLPLPQELSLPWSYLQSHFGLCSESGNNTSNLVLNFTPSDTYALQINPGLSQRVTTSEEAFARVFHEVEVLGLPVYHAVVSAVLAHARGDMVGCLVQARRVAAQLRPLLSSYYDRVHDARIAKSAWLSHVQGFYAWGLGLEGEGERQQGGKEVVKFDGLSGNQVLLFQVLDAFLGIEPYLSEENLNRNVPEKQRVFCRAVERHSFRSRLRSDGVEGQIRGELGEIVKRLRLFRTAHRSRAKAYLSQPAPERLPMTAGKSLLKEDMDQSLEYLDEFMVGRLAQTV